MPPTHRWPAAPPASAVPNLLVAARLDDVAGHVRARAEAAYRLAADPGLVGPAGDALRVLLEALASDTHAVAGRLDDLTADLRSTT